MQQPCLPGNLHRICCVLLPLLHTLAACPCCPCCLPDASMHGPLIGSCLTSVAINVRVCCRSKYGRRLHMFKRSCDLMLLILAVALSLRLKINPEIDDASRALAISIMVLVVFILEEEARVGYLFACNEQATDVEDRLSFQTLLSLTLQHMRCHHTHVMVLGHFFLVGASLLVLRGGFPSPDDFNVKTVYVPNYGTVGDGLNDTSRRMLRASSGGGSDSPGEYFDLVDEGQWNWLWFCLGVSELFLFWHFASVAFTPFSKVHLLLLSIGEIFAGDVSVFFVVYIWLVLTFGTVHFTI